MPKKRRIRLTMIASVIAAAIGATLLVTVTPDANAATGNPFVDAAQACKRWVQALLPTTPTLLGGPGEGGGGDLAGDELVGGRDNGFEILYGYEPVPEIIDNGGPQDQDLAIRQNHFAIDREQIERIRHDIGDGHFQIDADAVANTLTPRIPGDRYIGDARCG